MTKEEFRKLNFRNIDDVVRINNEECCCAFNNVYKLDGDYIYELIMARLKKYDVLNVKWLLEDVHTNNGDDYVYMDNYGYLKDVDESYFDILKDDLEKELEGKGFFEEEEEDEEE